MSSALLRKHHTSMMPGGHFVVSLGLSAGAAVASKSWEPALAIFAGGFLIDVDHYFDYLFVEKQWRRPWPKAFLAYYFDSREKKLFLPLHSWELMAALAFIAGAWRSVPLTAYWIGAFVHLLLDIAVNGEVILKRPILTYSFAFRAANRFSAERMITISPVESTRLSVFRRFFSIRPATAHKTKR